MTANPIFCACWPMRLPLVNAVAIWVATLIVPGVSIEGGTLGKSVVALLVVFMFAALTTRLWFLQVLAVAQYRDEARNNSVSFAETDALRGTIKDANGQRWFLKFDPRGYRGMSTGTEVTATKLMWALGYNVPENHIAYVRRWQLVVGDGKERERLVEDVVLAVSPSVGGDRRGSFEFEIHLTDVPPSAVPGRRRCQPDAVLVATREHERPAPDERNRAVPVWSVPLVDMPRPGEKRRLREQVQEVVPRFAQPDLERVFVDGVRLDALQPSCGGHVVLEHPVKGEGEIVRRERRAIAPYGVAAKREPVRPTVVGDREALGEIGLDLEVASDRDEASEEAAYDPVCEVAGGESWC